MRDRIDFLKEKNNTKFSYCSIRVDLIASSLWIIASIKDQNSSFIELTALKEKNNTEFSYCSIRVDLIASSLWIIASIKDQEFFIYRAYCTQREE